MIGYDVLNFAWQRHVDVQRQRISDAWARGELPTISRSAIQAAEKLAKVIRRDVRTDPGTRAAYAAQWHDATLAVAAKMRANGDDWRVTDFMTLGSPLTYGDLLLAQDRLDFSRRTRERELPQSPPVRELVGRFSFRHQDVDDQGRLQGAWILNQGAIFAATAWTNLYFPFSWPWNGDFVGGPVAPLFCAGAKDIPVVTKVWGGRLSHTHYWTRDKRNVDPATDPVVRLRDALGMKVAAGPAAGTTAGSATVAPAPTAVGANQPAAKSGDLPAA